MAYYGMGRPSQYGWILKALREVAEELASQFHGLDEADLCWQAFADEPSLKEIICYLRQYEEMNLNYLERLLREREPHLEAVDVDSLAQEYAQTTAGDEALYHFLRLRQETSYLLWGLSPEEWQRQGWHPFRGALTTGDIARDLMEHDLGYLSQIRRLRALLMEHQQATGETDRGI